MPAEHPPAARSFVHGWVRRRVEGSSGESGYLLEQLAVTHSIQQGVVDLEPQQEVGIAAERGQLRRGPSVQHALARNAVVRAEPRDGICRASRLAPDRQRARLPGLEDLIAIGEEAAPEGVEAPEIAAQLVEEDIGISHAPQPENLAGDVGSGDPAGVVQHQPLHDARGDGSVEHGRRLYEEGFLHRPRLAGRPAYSLQDVFGLSWGEPVRIEVQDDREAVHALTKREAALVGQQISAGHGHGKRPDPPRKVVGGGRGILTFRDIDGKATHLVPECGPSAPPKGPVTDPDIRYFIHALLHVPDSLASQGNMRDRDRVVQSDPAHAAAQIQAAGRRTPVPFQIHHRCLSTHSRGVQRIAEGGQQDPGGRGIPALCQLLRCGQGPGQP